ncbi:MAG: hypothetical protein ACI4DW_01400 [Lachnospiraceae bacterium]
MSNSSVYNSEIIRKILKKIAVFFLIAMGIELFIFNYRSIMTMLNKPQEFLEFGDVVLHNISVQNDSFCVEDENAYIRIDEVNEKVTELKVQLSFPNDTDLPGEENNVCNVEILYSYPDSEGYYIMKQQKIVEGNTSSYYISVYPTKAVEKIMIRFELETGSNFKIEDIKINARRPFDFNFIRIGILFVLVFMVSIYLPSSKWWNIKFTEKTSACRHLIFGYIVVVALLTWFVLNANHAYGVVHVYRPYQLLAEALAEGHTNLNISVSEELKNLEDPYDPFKRLEIDAQNDLAYFDGNYYVYNGVVPCILFYLPLKLLTGLNMPTPLVMEILILLMLTGMYFLLKQIVLKYFPDVSFLNFFIMYIASSIGCQIMHYANQPDDYIIPIFTGMVLCIWGLYFWLKSVVNTESPKLFYVTLGSLCMALVAGCRPQMLLYSISGLAIFDFFLFKKKSGEKRSKFKFIFSALLPFAIVGILLMFYNKVRFGSVFDFGEKYNLTAFDMRLAEISIDKVWKGIYLFLFSLPTFYNDFPFVLWQNGLNDSFGFSGMYIEAIPGGVITCNLILLFAFAITTLKNKKNLYKFSIILTVSWLIIMIFDIEYIGIVYRYLSDFSFIIFIVSFMVVMNLEQTITGMKYYKEKALNIFRNVIVCLCLLSIVFNILLLFMHGDKYPMIYANTELFYKWYYGFCFWI